MSELPPMPDLAERLHDVLIRLGRERMITRSALTRNVLKDLFPADQLAVSLLVAAVEDGAAVALDRQGADVDPGLLIPRLADDLARSRGLSVQYATWAIDTWAQAMDLTDTARPDPAATQDMPMSAMATELIERGAPIGGTVVAPPAGAQPQAPPPEPAPPQAPPPPVLPPVAPAPDLWGSRTSARP